jgi:hypothetical protein
MCPRPASPMSSPSLRQRAVPIGAPAGGPCLTGNFVIWEVTQSRKVARACEGSDWPSLLGISEASQPVVEIAGTSLSDVPISTRISPKRLDMCPARVSH